MVDEKTEDECYPTKYLEVKEPMVDLYIDARQLVCDSSHNFNNAQNAIFNGSVTKIYCSGEVSSKFNYNTYFNPSSMSNSELSFIKMGQTYQFKFENSKDYLLYLYTLKAYFPDGKIFQSDPITRRAYFSNLYIDINTGINYYMEEFAGIKWVEVSS
jgi:hypothetical protein